MFALSSLTSPLLQIGSGLFAISVLQKNKINITSFLSQSHASYSELSTWQWFQLSGASLFLLQSFKYRPLHLPLAFLIGPSLYYHSQSKEIFFNLKKLNKISCLLASLCISNFILNILPIRPDFKTNGTISKIIAVSCFFFTSLSLMKKITSFVKINNIE
jgi:hypothetical protein